jgi:hypothetical protein
MHRFLLSLSLYCQAKRISTIGSVHTPLLFTYTSFHLILFSLSEFFPLGVLFLEKPFIHPRNWGSLFSPSPAEYFPSLPQLHFVELVQLQLLAQ